MGDKMGGLAAYTSRIAGLLRIEGTFGIGDLLIDCRVCCRLSRRHSRLQRTGDVTSCWSPELQHETLASSSSEFGRVGYRVGVRKINLCEMRYETAELTYSRQLCRRWVRN